MLQSVDFATPNRTSASSLAHTFVHEVQNLLIAVYVRVV
jgi:hypothetical protein